MGNLSSTNTTTIVYIYTSFTPRRLVPRGMFATEQSSFRSVATLTWFKFEIFNLDFFLFMLLRKNFMLVKLLWLVSFSSFKLRTSYRFFISMVGTYILVYPYWFVFCLILGMTSLTPIPCTVKLMECIIEQ